MVFDVGSETFSVIVIPNFILDLLCLNELGPLVNVLVEVDGHITILVPEGDDLLKLWIYFNGAMCTNWIGETIKMPRHWDEINHLAFKALTGKALIVIKFLPKPQGLEYERHQLGECLHFYNRKEKKYYKNQFEIELDGGGHFY
ncbi:hypothetical protein MKW98_006101, partial [Papaver atlanticum]